MAYKLKIAILIIISLTYVLGNLISIEIHYYQ